MLTLLFDLRQSFRSLLRSPGFLITATLCLALGIGANLAVISHVDRLVLRPLPYPDSGRLAVIEPMDNQNGEINPMTMADFVDLQAQAKGFQALAACTSRNRTLTGLGEPLRVEVGMVTADFFGVLGVKPALGRVVFRPDEEVLPATVGILRHEFWMAHFHGDPGVLGRTVVLDGRAVQVVGVLPAGFRFYERLQESQVITPEATPFAGRNNRGLGTFLAIGRLRPDTSFSQVQTEAHVAAGRIGAAAGDPRFDLRVSSLLDRTAAEYRQVLLTFQGAVAVVLLITCFNVAGLQLVRDMARRRDLALSLLTGLGLAFLSWAMARRAHLMEALRAGSRGGHARGHWRVLKGLVVSEVALSVMLLMGAGLLIHTLLNLRNTNPGFEAGHVLTLNVPLPPQKYTLDLQKSFIQQLELSLKAIPGVQEVGINDTLPFVKAVNAGFVSETPRGAAGSDTGAAIHSRAHIVSAGYFQTMGIPILAGRTFQPSEPRGCILNRSLAAKLWSGADPIGRPVYLGPPEPFIVSGVVGDTAENDVRKKEIPQFYLSAETAGLFEGPVVVVKVAGAPMRYGAQVKAAIRNLDLDLALPEPRPMEGVMRERLAEQSVASILFFTFGVLALLLAAVGLYGVLTQIALQRRRDIGIRMSLGASRTQVVLDMLFGAGGMVGLGLILGSVFGWGMSRALGQWLYGLSQAGPLIYLGVLALLVPAALAACLIPALRAARVNPAEVLRSE